MRDNYGAISQHDKNIITIIQVGNRVWETLSSRQWFVGITRWLRQPDEAYAWSVCHLLYVVALISTASAVRLPITSCHCPYSVRYSAHAFCPSKNKKDQVFLQNTQLSHIWLCQFQIFSPALSNWWTIWCCNDWEFWPSQTASQQILF